MTRYGAKRIMTDFIAAFWGEMKDIMTYLD